GQHWDFEKQSIQVQQTEGASLAHAGDGGAEGYPLVQSEQIHAGFSGADPVRDRQKRLERNPNRKRVQSQQEGKEARMTSRGILRHAQDISARLYPFFTICVTIDRQYTTVFSSIKRMVMLALPIAFSSAIGVFAPVFSRPVWQHVKVLMTGAVLAPGQRTVTAILRIMGRSTAPNFQPYHRVRNRAVWSPLTASRLLLRLLVAVFIPRGIVVFGLDDTIERRRGKQITAKGIYRDPVRSSHTHVVKASG